MLRFLLPALAGSLLLSGVQAFASSPNIVIFFVDDMGMDFDRVGYITYGHEKMYITELDAERTRGREREARLLDAEERADV